MEPTSNSNNRGHRWELIAYLAVGGLNTLVGYGVYALGLFLGLHYSAATLVSQIVGTGFNYLTYGQLVFRKKPSRNGFVGFAFFYAVLYGASILNLTVLQNFGVDAYVAGLVNVVLMPVFSYLANRFVVFRSKKEGTV